MTRRRLPHLYAIGSPLFVTFRLHNSLPANRPFTNSSVKSGEAFVAMDRLLDSVHGGPTFLKQPEIAAIIQRSIERGVELNHYELHAWVIMPNHVHLLITPKVSAARLLGSLKGATAKRANEVLGRIGSFWQDESYDRLVRNPNEFDSILRYIESNPVHAGLARTPQDYPWSSARRSESPPQAEGLPHRAGSAEVG